VNSARSHQTALHMAASKQHDAVARLLVDFGADVYMENKSGLRPSDLVAVHLPLHQFLRHCESRLHSMMINSQSLVDDISLCVLALIPGTPGLRQFVFLQEFTGFQN